MFKKLADRIQREKMRDIDMELEFLGAKRQLMESTRWLYADMGFFISVLAAILLFLSGRLLFALVPAIWALAILSSYSAALVSAVWERRGKRPLLTKKAISVMLAAGFIIPSVFAAAVSLPVQDETESGWAPEYTFGYYSIENPLAAPINMLSRDEIHWFINDTADLTLNLRFGIYRGGVNTNYTIYGLAELNYVSGYTEWGGGFVDNMTYPILDTRPDGTYNLDLSQGDYNAGTELIWESYGAGWTKISMNATLSRDCIDAMPMYGYQDFDIHINGSDDLRGLWFNKIVNIRVWKV